MCKFFKLTREIQELVNGLNLGNNDYKLWLYFITLDPFGDRYVEIPSSPEIIKKLNISRSGYFKAKAKLQSLGLIDFIDHKTEIINKLGDKYESTKIDFDYNHQSMRVDSQSMRVDSQSMRVDSQSMRVDSQSMRVDSRSPKPLPDKDSNSPQTIQTIQTNQTFLEGKKNEEKTKEIISQKTESMNSEVSDLISSEIKSANRETENESTSLTEKNQGLLVKPTNPGKEQITPQVDPFFGQKRNQSNFGDWIPDGPWLKISSTGRRHLDNAFVEYRAKKFFVKNWGDDLPEAVSKTIKYYRNDIERLAIDWEEYNATSLVTAANIQAYTKSTGEVKQSDVEKLESIKSAFQVLPAEVRSTDKVIDFKPVVAQTVPQYQEIRELSAENPKTINSTYKAIEAPNTAQEYRTTVTIENEATPEQKAEFFKAFKQMFSGKSNRSMSKVKDQQEKTKISKTHLDVLNEQLCDPICRTSVMREVMNSEKYQFSYNELTGEPQSVVLIADAV